MFEINVTLNGQHLFATAERSLISWGQCVAVYRVFKRKFPKTEGFGVSVTEWDKRGTKVNMEAQKELQSE